MLVAQTLPSTSEFITDLRADTLPHVASFGAALITVIAVVSLLGALRR